MNIFFPLKCFLASNHAQMMTLQNRPVVRCAHVFNCWFRELTVLDNNKFTMSSWNPIEQPAVVCLYPTQKTQLNLTQPNVRRNLGLHRNRSMFLILWIWPFPFLAATVPTRKAEIWRQRQNWVILVPLQWNSAICPLPLPPPPMASHLVQPNPHFNTTQKSRR